MASKPQVPQVTAAPGASRWRIPAVELLLVFAAAACSLVMLEYAAVWKLRWSWFHAWVVTPYIAYLLLRALLGSETQRMRLAGRAAAIVMVLLTAFFYVDALMIHASSTSALIFIFAPGYIAISAVVTIFVAWIAARRLGNTT